jgi:hypothetical protein
LVVCKLTPEEAEQILKIMIPSYDPEVLRVLFERAQRAPEEAKQRLYTCQEDA